MADSAPATNGGSIDSLKGNAQAAYSQLANGPAAQSVKDQHAKASSEFSNLASARQTPATPAATGQPLTHYHSFFSELLSWNNPRASGIAYASAVVVILAARYLDVLRYFFRLTWMALGITVLAEVVGKTVLSNGLASQLRPRKYYTVPRETLDGLIGDVHELVNFFVIEAQRIFFAENVSASAVAAIGAFISYYLVKIVPYWGLALVATTLLFFVPLVYTTNQELIDHHIKQASEIVNNQTQQFRSVAGKHTAQATELGKQYVGDYTTKAQQMLRGNKPASSGHETASSGPQESDFPAAPKEPEFPVVPKEEFKSEDEPLIAN